MSNSFVMSGLAAWLVVFGSGLTLIAIWNVPLSSPAIGQSAAPATWREQGESRCGDRPWPHYAPGCLRDLSQPDGQARPARIVTPQAAAGGR